MENTGLIPPSTNAHLRFADQTRELLRLDPEVIGLAAAGSWITAEMDEFSDLDLVIVTHKKIGGNKDQMIGYANALGNLVNAFTGEHVGESRLLICLYSPPLLHVDLKFATLQEFEERIETPILLLDKGGQLQKALAGSQAVFPYPDFQWIEDRFWTWIHYALLKIGRGELFEALDFISYLRINVLGPLLHIRSGNLPRGVRKVETTLNRDDLAALKTTLAGHDKESLLSALGNAIELYLNLRDSVFPDISFRQGAQKEVMHYYLNMKGAMKG